MKILFDHFSPFLLAHGGFQVQIEETKTALEECGAEVEFLRWWDASQRGDLIHFFGPPAQDLSILAHHKGLKVVMSQLLGGLGARSTWQRSLQKLVIAAAHRTLSSKALARLGWQAWKTADAYVAVTSWERQLMVDVFQAPKERVHVVPNGVSDIFFQPAQSPRGRWLVTTASIFPVKRLLETAHAAVIAQTPYWVVGQPLSHTDAYYQKFVALCRQHPELLRYEAAVLSHEELAKIYQQARGFVLLSRWESQSLAALEAAASECPLLLSDLPWAHATFAETASYCPLGSPDRTANCLRRFYEQAPNLPTSLKPATWSDVGRRLKDVYQGVLEQPFAAV